MLVNLNVTAIGTSLEWPLFAEDGSVVGIEQCPATAPTIIDILHFFAFCCFKEDTALMYCG